jgi:uncharacterized membrane protein
MRFLLPLWIIAAAAAALQGYYVTQLPERVAVHFNAAGVADRWESPTYMATASLIALGIMTLVGSVSVLIVGAIPDQYVNLPNKAHWLDPVRRDQTIAWLRGFVSALTSSGLLVLAIIFHFTFEYNQGNREAMGAPLQVILFGAMPLLTIVPVVIVLKKFRRAPENS